MKTLTSKAKVIITAVAAAVVAAGIVAGVLLGRTHTECLKYSSLWVLHR